MMMGGGKGMGKKDTASISMDERMGMMGNRMNMMQMMMGQMMDHMNMMGEQGNTSADHHKQ